MEDKFVPEKCVIPGYYRVYRKVVTDEMRAISLEVFVLADEQRKDRVRTFVNGTEVTQEDFDFIRDIAEEPDGNRF